MTAIKKSNTEISLESIGFGSTIRVPNVDLSALPKPAEFKIAKLEPEGGCPIGEFAFNCIVFLVFCDRHKRIVLSFNQRTSAAWFPFIVAPPNKTWSETTSEGLSIIFARDDPEMDARPNINIPCTHINTLHVHRLQLPFTQMFIWRIFQLVTLGSNTNTFKCCQNSKRLQWFELNDAIAGNILGLWGPEVPIFCSYIVDGKQQEIQEYSLDKAYSYLSKGSKKVSEETKMIQALGLGKDEFEKLYSEFLEHCFPSPYMTHSSFMSFLEQFDVMYKGNAEMLTQLFYAFNSNKSGYLDFCEFLLGIVALDPNCPHTESRTKFVFRFYDLDQDELLNVDEFSSLVNDMKLKVADYKNILATSDHTVTFAMLNELIASGNIKSCHQLCRFPVPIVPQIIKNFDKRNETQMKRKNGITQRKSDDKERIKLCQTHDAAYEFGSHCVRLDNNGRCVDHRKIIEYNDNEDIGQRKEDGNASEISVYKYSEDYVFSTVSIGHTVLDMIRNFSNDKGTIKSPKGFLSDKDSRDEFIRNLNLLCQNVRGLLECEEKLVKVNGPTIVIGDIRGNLDQLLLMERVFWHSIPVVANNFVFLGNYVNVGKWSVECVLYILSLKIVAPNKFFLMRGNNECRVARSDFFDECLHKYGAEHGLVVYNRIHEIFDRMCLAVVIDESVLCVNSGVPDAPLQDLRSLPANLKDPDKQPILKEILTNTKQSEENIVDLLKKNQLTHVVRGNIATLEGFQISPNGRCINVFSTPNHGNRVGEEAVVLIDHPKIRIIKIDRNAKISNTNIPILVKKDKDKEAGG